MHDLPQQPPDYQVVDPIEEEPTSGVTHDGVEFDILDPLSPPMVRLGEKDLFRCAHFLHAKYAKGFTWTELPEIIETVRGFVGPNPEMCLKEKRKACIEIIHYMMVSLDTLYLPEKATDPFFGELITPFVEVALDFPKETALIQPLREGPLTEETLVEYARQIKEHFEEEGLNWKNLSLATKYANNYVLTYKETSLENRVGGAFAIVETILSETPLSRLPDHYDEKLFKTFLKNFIRQQVAS